MSTAAERASRWVRPEFYNDAAYHVAKVGDVIKLDANESPWPWPESIKDAWLERIRDIEMNRYPDAPASALQDQIRAAWEIPETLDILVGNGSDECIQIVETGVAGPGRVVMAPAPTFVVYERTAIALGSRFVGVPLTERFELDAERMIVAVKEHNPACVFFAWPNNPTGNLFDRDAMRRVIQSTDGLCVVDEAYGAFSGESFIDEIAEHPNVVIMRTLSKIGMAGLRLGVLIGDPAWISEFHKVRMPYNVNTLTQVSAAFALEHQDAFVDGINALASETRQLVAAVGDMPGIECFESDSNFFLARVTSHGGATGLREALLERGIAIKSFHQPGTPLDSCVRISTGTPDENARLLQALAEITKS